MEIPALDQPTFELVKAFVTCADADAQSAFAQSHPSMLHQRLLQIFCNLPQPFFEQFLAASRAAGATTETQGDPACVHVSLKRFPVGHGPIEALWSQVESKTISEAFAIEQVGAPEFGRTLTYAYIWSICESCFKDLCDGQTERAFNRQNLVLEATEALAGQPPFTSDDDVWAMRPEAARRWFETTSARLTAVADPRLLRRAEQVGQTLIEEARRRSDRAMEGRLLQRLAVVFLDPYTARFSMDSKQNYEFQLELWQNRLRDHLGPEYDQLPASDRKMRPALQALASAETYLRQALEIPENPDHGGTIPALLQAIVAQEILGKPTPLSEKIALAQKGLTLTPTGLNERRVRLTTWLNGWLREQADGNAQAPVNHAVEAFEKTLLETPIEELCAAEGSVRLADAVAQSINGCARQGTADVGLKLIGRFRALLFKPGLIDDKRRLSLWQTEIIFLQRSIRDGKDDRPDGQERIKKLADTILFAINSGHDDNEAKGLEALSEVMLLAPRLFVEHVDAFRALRARLSFGEGRNRFNVPRRLVDATVRYVEAMTDYADLNVPDQVFECLNRLNDVLGLGYAPAVFKLIRELEPVAGKIEALAGEAATLRLQTLYRNAGKYFQSASGQGTLDADTIYRTLRLAKGHWLAGALQAHAHYDWREDAEALRQLELIDQAAKALGLEGDTGWGGDGPLAETLLANPAGDHEQRPGSDAEQRYENLRLAFNDHIRRRQAKGAEPPRESANLMAFQQSIAQNGIVLDYFIGDDRIYVLAITADRALLCSSPPLSGGAAQVASLVARLREALGETPAVGPVSRRAAALLQEGADLLLLPLEKFLAEEKSRGRDHLIIVPHNALHFLPFHLLGAEVDVAADHWLVTYLPLATMLRPPSPNTAAPAAENPLAAIGLDFLDKAYPRITPVKEAPAFVRALASAQGGIALVNTEATEARVTAAMQTARAAHIFTHGEQCAYAASFHALYLSPDPAAQTDGILRAYEILPLHCEELEVVTLSACESALGRFDAGDNLTGLPGSLFLAGVQRVIGTLWPVATDVATIFFDKFYAELKAGNTFSLAFQEAQKSARDQHAQHRDWGAFYFMGPPASAVVE